MPKIIVDKTIEEIIQILKYSYYPIKERGSKIVVYHSDWIALRLRFVRVSQNAIQMKAGCDIPLRTLIVFIFLFFFPLLFLIGFVVFWYYERKFEKELGVLLEYSKGKKKIVKRLYGAPSLLC